MSELITVELSDEVSASVRAQAAARGISPAQYLAELAWMHSGPEGAAAFFKARAARADWDAFARVFGTNREGGEPPRAGDELP